MTLREWLDRCRWEIERWRNPQGSEDRKLACFSLRAQLRRLWWRLARCHDGEICGSCGLPVERSCPSSWWTTTNELWAKVVGYRAGIRCIPCFSREAAERGVQVVWFAGSEDEVRQVAWPSDQG